MDGSKQTIEDGCPLRGTVNRLGDRWSVLTLSVLDTGPARFNELRRQVTLHCVTSPISARMLTVTLRALERDGLVTRTIFPTIPPRVEYELTKLGRSLWKAVEPLGNWAQGHIGDIRKAQEKFERQKD